MLTVLGLVLQWFFARFSWYIFKMINILSCLDGVGERSRFNETERVGSIPTTHSRFMLQSVMLAWNVLHGLLHFARRNRDVSHIPFISRKFEQWMDVQLGSIDSASDSHAGGMSSKLGEVNSERVWVAERRSGDGDESWRTDNCRCPSCG